MKSIKILKIKRINHLCHIDVLFLYVFYLRDGDFILWDWIQLLFSENKLSHLLNQTRDGWTEKRRVERKLITRMCRQSTHTQKKKTIDNEMHHIAHRIILKRIKEIRAQKIALHWSIFIFKYSILMHGTELIWFTFKQEKK